MIDACRKITYSRWSEKFYSGTLRDLNFVGIKMCRKNIVFFCKIQKRYDTIERYETKIMVPSLRKKLDLTTAKETGKENQPPLLTDFSVTITSRLRQITEFSRNSNSEMRLALMITFAS